MYNSILLSLIITLFVTISGCKGTQSPEDQFKVGKTYQNGEGVEKNIKKAAEWYKKSADGGFRDAQVHIGYMYAKGIGVDQNMDSAIHYFKLAADQGDEESIKLLKALAEEEKQREEFSRMSYPERYAAEIKSKMLAGGVCGQFTQMIDNFATSTSPDNIKIIQIDKIIDKADKYGCLQY